MPVLIGTTYVTGNSDRGGRRGQSGDNGGKNGCAFMGRGEMRRKRERSPRYLSRRSNITRGVVPRELFKRIPARSPSRLPAIFLTSAATASGRRIEMDGKDGLESRVGRLRTSISLSVLSPGDRDKAIRRVRLPSCHRADRNGQR